MPKSTRRGFLIAGAAIGGTVAGALALGVGFLSTVDTDGYDSVLNADGSVGVTAWVTFFPDGRIVFNVPRLEMGQGVFTSLPMLIAEELEIDLSDEKVSVEHPSENLPVYANLVLALRKRPEDISGAADWLGKKIYSFVPFIGTGGSTSVVDAYTPLRKAGAVAREMFVTAAAQHWGAQPKDCFANKGMVRHIPTGMSVNYTDLLERVAEVTPRGDVALKPVDRFSVIGNPVQRLDIPAKTRGEATFGMDVVLDGMKYAAVKHCPVFGGTVVSYDDSAARQVKGYVKTVNLGNAVAVVADSYYRAKQAAELVDVSYDVGDQASLTSKEISEHLLDAVANNPGHVFVGDEGMDTMLATGDLVEAYYDVPYLAHACMEPMNTTALVKDSVLEIWSGTQVPIAMEWAGTEVPDGVEKVIGHTVFAGGGFGRRAEKDFIVQAVKVAAAVPGVPVKTIWSREEDIQHDMYRPAAAARVRAILDERGMPAALDFKVALQNVSLSFSRRNMPIEQGGDSDPMNVEGALHIPYNLPARRVAAAGIDLPVPVGNWRSVGHSQNSFFFESFIDELAHKAGTDPMMYRLSLLAGNARTTKLAEQLAAHARWGAPKAENQGRGIAIHSSFRSTVGLVIDISETDGLVKIDKVTCVVDCGRVVNPDTVVAQMEGGIIYGLTAAMFGEITIDKGRVAQSNFPDYPMMQLHQTPEINVHIIESNELPGGVGEPGTPPAFPALANAYFDLKGQRLRSMPLSKHGVEFL